MSKKRLALIVSRIFDPVWIIPLLLTMSVLWSVLNGLRWRFILLLVLIDGFIPFIYFVHLLRTKEISDWDTTKRQQRHRLYWFTVAVHGVGVMMAFLLGKIILAKILFSFWILAVVFAGITLKWKISLHTGVSASAVAFIAYLFGSEYMLLFLLVILIAWGRIIMAKHTLKQAIAGALLAPLILFAMFRLLSLDRQEAQAPSEVNLLLK